jgi:hypothetical protein
MYALQSRIEAMARIFGLDHIGMRRIASAASDSGKTKFFYNCFDRWTDGRKYFLKRRLRGDQAGLEWLWARGLAALAPPDKG